MKLIAIIIVLLFLTISLIVCVKLNPLLEIDVYCTSDAQCHSLLALCNTNGRCQCRWQYAPFSSKNNGTMDGCNVASCKNSGICKVLYNDKNTTCTNNPGGCVCDAGFDYDTITEQCEYYRKDVQALGGKCSISNECGGGTICSNYGYCQCRIGYIPQNNITCNIPKCDSDEFCRGRITANSVCNSVSSNCHCSGDYKDDNDLNICIKRAIAIGEYCNKEDKKMHCGNEAMCLENVCRCPFGYSPSTNAMDCEFKTCITNFECLEQDINSECIERKCQCQDEYMIDSKRGICVKQKSVNIIISIILSSFAGFVFFCNCVYLIAKLVKHHQRIFSKINVLSPLKQ